MAKWLIDKTKFYIPCPECGYAFGEMYENYIKGSPNRIHYFFRCRKCNCFIETKKKNKLMDVYLDKMNSEPKVKQGHGSLDDAIEILTQMQWHDEDGYSVEDYEDKKQYAKDWIKQVPKAELTKENNQ